MSDELNVDSAALELSLLTAFKQRLSSGPGSRYYDRDSDDDILDFAENELHVKVRSVPVIREVFLSIINDARRKRIIRDAILGPRGGGKTRFAATLELVLYRFFGYDCQNVGGSLKQARRCYEYILEGHELSENLASYLLRQPTMTETRSKNGNTIQISAASDTSIRGPHPGSDKHGGIVVIDEVAVMKDKHVDASKGQLTSANPSACVQLSTMGERQTGRWHELIEDHAHKGYRLHSFDIFDVAKRCEYDCETTCPNIEHFARDYFLELGGDQQQFVHKAYCAGKAKDVDGWVSVDEIAMQFTEMERAVFERELMGVNTAVIGKVFDPLLLSRATVDNVLLGDDYDSFRTNLLKMDKAIGHDWGWSGMSAACYMVRWRKTLIVYRWEMWDHTSYTEIAKHLMARAYEENIEVIMPDGAEPSVNDDMRRMCDLESERRYRRDSSDDFGVAVRPVTFSKWKEYGYGELRRRLEQDDANKRPLIVFPKNINGVPVSNFDRAMSMIRQHQRRDDGKPSKENDHPSDALMCGALHWSLRWSAVPVLM